MNGLWRWKERYDRAMLPTIPVARGTKQPILAAWQRIPPGEQWSQVGRDKFRGNLAILLGGGTVVIDCDAPQTVEAVSGKLEALGLRTPYVHTPGGGRHYYLQVNDVPDGFNWTPLNIGPGELRARNATIMVPCSTYDTRRYQWAYGFKPEDVPTQRPVKWRDLSWLIKSQDALTEPLQEPPVRLLWRTAPAYVEWLLRVLRTAPKSQPIGKYRQGELIGKYASRSEAEAAVVAILILSGWPLAEIREQFDDARPGHYAEYEKPSYRRRYLETTYRNVLNELAQTPERQQIASWYRLAEVGDWPGRGGTLERATYLAIAATGWQFSTDTPAAAQRDIAQHAAAGRRGVHNAIGRLIQNGLIRKVHNRRAANHATSYQIQAYMPQPFTGENSAPYTGLSVTYGARITHSNLGELWKRDALGRSAGAVYAHLTTEAPLTVNELARRTGKTRKTVRRALHRLAEYELAAPQGTARNGNGAAGWLLGRADVGDVADEFDCDVDAERRRWRHELEREAFQEALMRSKEAAGERSQ